MFAAVAVADVPRLVSYSGKIAGAAGGTATMRVMLWDAPVGGVLLFSEIHAGVPLNNGVFSIMLGSETAGGVDDAALDATEVWLGINLGAGELAPRTRIGMVPYAAKARSAEQLVSPGTFDAVMRTDSLGNVDVDNHLNFALQTAPLITAGHNNTIDKRMWIAHSETFPTWGIQYRDLSSDGFAGDSIEFTAGDQTSPRMSFEVFSSRMHMMNSGGTENITLDSAAGGNITAAGTVSAANVHATTSAQALSFMAYMDTLDGTRFASLEANGGGGGILRTRDEAGVQTTIMGSSGAIGGFATLSRAGGGTGITLDAEVGAGPSSAGAQITVHQADGSTGVTIDGDATNADGGGAIQVRNNVSGARVSILGESTGTGGEISVFDADGTETIEMLGAESSTTGAQINLAKADGSVSISIDADFNGDGRIITDELQITGGSDLSEQFDITSSHGAIEPGMVVSINPNNPGELLVSSGAYDRTVAGVISGAGGVKTGLMMGQRGTVADGKHAVALTGRVWVHCDASSGAIQPGDLLTTAALPGHAMKVTDHARANGAILGKAMSSLESGQGLVLVLVSLQ